MGLDATAGHAFDGIIPGIERMRLIVGRVCKINVRAADNFGNARSTGGDNVLAGPYPSLFLILPFKPFVAICCHLSQNPLKVSHFITYRCST